MLIKRAMTKHVEFYKTINKIFENGKLIMRKSENSAKFNSYKGSILSGKLFKCD